MRASAWPYARNHGSWPDALALIAASPLRGDIHVDRNVRPPVFTAKISRCVRGQTLRGEGSTPLEAVQNALARAEAASADAAA